ncbi:hypothetical protein G7Y79_00025g057010 [Physcia stellaris]|nr:hypothetical protein G7Y79_00025g057010 [Physcia stellaris]
MSSSISQLVPKITLHPPPNMERPTGILLATMGFGLVSGYHSLTTVSAVAFIALRYAYDAGCRDAQAMEEEKARGVLRTVEEEQDSDEGDALEEERTRKPAASDNGEKEDAGRTTSGSASENGIAKERNLQMFDQETVITDVDVVSGMRDPLHGYEAKGFEVEREDEETSVTERSGRVSQVVERTICDRGMDAKCEVADWGVDPEEQSFEC